MGTRDEPHITPLRTWRRQRMMKQSALAGLIGCSAEQLCRWEMGKHQPSLSAMKKICDATGLTMKQVLGDDPLPPPGAPAQEVPAKRKRGGGLP